MGRIFMPHNRTSKASDQTHWKFIKDIPIALILAISLQTAAIVWWASGINERVSVLEKRADYFSPQSDRLTKVEAKLESVQDGISEIKRMLQLRPTK